MKRILIAALIGAMVPLVAASAAGAANYPKHHGVSCEVGYHARLRHHWVWHHHRHLRRGYLECVASPAVTSSTVTSPALTSPPPATSPSLSVSLDPTFSQGTTPYAVTYTASASATSGGMPLVQLPAGVLNFYSDGLLICSTAVGAAVNTTNCLVNYSTLGKHTVVTEYVSGTNSATQTNTEDILPFTPTVTATPSVGTEFVDGSSNWAQTVTVAISVTGAGVTPLGQAGITGWTCVDDMCSTTVENQPTASTLNYTASYSGDGNYSGASVSGSVTIPAAPAPNVVDKTTSLTAGVTDLSSSDPGFSNLTAQVDTIPNNSTGTVTFTWDGTDGPESCSIMDAVFGLFTCGPVSNPTLFPAGTVITASYSGETVTAGDASETVYEPSSGTVDYP
jgi:large repetitive protein